MSVRVGVIGCGWWATYAHLPALAAHPEAEIVAVADADPERAAAAARAFGVPAIYPSAEALLEIAEVDAVVVAAPNAHHHPIAKLALERGLHVLLEKPMTIEPAHARELIALARARAVELVVGYPLHYNAQALALRRAIAAGAIGPVESVACVYASIVRHLYGGDPEAYRDVVFDYPVHAPASASYSDPVLAGGGQGQSQISHAAALLIWLTGLRLERVAAFTAGFGLPVDLADALALSFVGGALGTLGSTGAVTAGQDEVVRCDVFGRDGHVLFDVNQGIATIHRDREVELLPAIAPEDRAPMAAPARNLVEVALGAAENGSPPEIGLAAVELVAAMYRSAAEERVVRIEEL